MLTVNLISGQRNSYRTEMWEKVQGREEVTTRKIKDTFKDRESNQNKCRIFTHTKTTVYYRL